MKGVGKPFRDKKQAEKKHVMKSKELEKKKKCFSSTFHQLEVKFLINPPGKHRHSMTVNRRVSLSGTKATRQK